MLLLPPDLSQRVQALLHQAVHPQASFAVVNEAILQLQALEPAFPPMAAAAAPPPPSEESHGG